MKKRPLPAWAPNAGLLALRMSVAAVFIYSGVMKLADIDMVSGMFASMGFPVAEFTAYFVAIVEVVCGGAVLIGLWTRMASILLAITMVVAILTAHLQGPFTAAIPAIAMLGSSLALAGVGGGKWTVYEDCPIYK